MALTRLGLNQSINLASNTTGTLAVGNGGTGLTSGTTDQILKFTGSTTLASAAEAAGGKVAQVKNVLISTETVVTNNTYTDTGLTLSITPSSSSNKILVFADCCGVGKQTNSTKARLRLLRDSTVIVDDFSKEAGSDNTTGPNKIGSVCTNFLDSPSSSSSVTYKVQLSSADNNALAQMGASGAKSTMTLMEISV
tara:strand:+ start:460 stop:1044 length:585 start_codon:yes stop_codon:yes gene_type:complete